MTAACSLAKRILILILSSINQFERVHHFHRVVSGLGLVISQIFMMEYAVVRFGDFIYGGKRPRRLRGTRILMS